MSLADLGAHLAGASDDDHRWRLLAEFLEEFRWAPPGERLHLLSAAPPSTQDRRWDVLLAALAEHLAAREGRAAPAWADGKILEQFWFPLNTDAARVDAFVHAPASLPMARRVRGGSRTRGRVTRRGSSTTRACA